MVGGQGELNNNTPTSISVSNNVVTLGISVKNTPLPTCSETLTVNPSSSSAIFDAAGNNAAASQSNNTVNLTEKIIPFNFI